jgi:putative tryptophan/tyrosine transport system substrate-binding protein
MRGLESPRALLAFLSIGLSWLVAGCERSPSESTRIFLDAVELNGKRLEVMREFIPGLSGVAVLWDASMDPAPLHAAQTASRAIGIQLQTFAIRSPAEFGSTLEAAAKARSGAVSTSRSTSRRRKRSA